MRVKQIVGMAMLLCVPVFSAHAIDVNITEEMADIVTVHNGKEVTIQRIQDQENVIPAGYSKTSRKCPPFCLQPMVVAPGVTTVGELEVLDFIENKLNKGKGVLIDSRTESWFNEGTIPGSINIPFTTFSDDSSDLVKAAAFAKFDVVRKDKSNPTMERLKEMFGSKSNKSRFWDYTNAKDLLLWCNGIWCGQSPHAIEGLLALGYPPEKIFYYRGGMQSWLSVGLTTVKKGD
ncbi:MAG: rhodanese-like domain-containing protein [Gammaproteobacteria bacterium]|nr:rhodanese-like domain-containing protein [Gammaproteobacteria bacterium]